MRDRPRPASNPSSTATPTGASPGAACVTQVSTIRISSCPSGVPSLSLSLSTSSELNPIPAPRFSASPNPASTYQNTRYRNLNPSPKARSFLLSEAPTLVIYNAPPIIKHLDLGESEREHGQVILWHADLDDAEGESANRIGYCNGTMHVTRSVDGHGDDREHRMTTIELDWEGNDDSLLVAGSHPYRHGEIETDTPIVRAIIGGTGKYMAARGQMVSHRLESGWYRHEIWIVQ